MTEFTPAPWLRDSYPSNITSRGWAIRMEDGCAIAYVLGERSLELAANARLITAAPEMYALLECIATNLEKGMPKSIQRMQAREIRELLKKARGEQRPQFINW